MIVATVLKSGGIYTPDHVYKLRDMVHKFIPHIRFVCLSDATIDVETIALTDSWPSWWSKIELFKLKGPVLYFDLDTIIVKDMTDTIAKFSAEQFVILRDFYRGKGTMQSSIMYWSGDMSFVYNLFKREPKFFNGGDQEFIEYAVREATCFQDLTDAVVSFKCHVLKRGLLPSDECVIFHGEPRPWRQDVISY